jgi:hypothetical protein
MSASASRKTAKVDVILKRVRGILEDLECKLVYIKYHTPDPNAWSPVEDDICSVKKIIESYEKGGKQPELLSFFKMPTRLYEQILDIVYPCIMEGCDSGFRVNYEGICSLCLGIQM